MKATKLIPFATMLLHAVIVTAVWLLKPPQQGFEYHFGYEPTYYKVLFYADYPAIVLNGYVFYLPGIDVTTTSGNVAFYMGLVLLTSAQWFLVGLILRVLMDVRAKAKR